ncbi:MAG: U32 family peptidase [Campylobacterales bacterium]
MSIELLSPAGDPEKLRIALSYGADAVYGGVSHFSLRIRSGRDFNYETFAESIRWTHERGKKVYATVNGFPFNSQVALVEEHLERMAAMQVDAIIVSTPGVIRMAQRHAPGIPLHLSTQANVLNWMDAAFYRDIGIKRIIAAREASLKDLEEIKAKVPDVELEVFVHGSMCFAYSGRCLISSLQMGRVPNRGSCANDCRMPYEIYVKNPEHNVLMRVEEDESGTYIFNAKDLNLAAHIKEIYDSGVIDSIKIEGRTKSAYYAAVATRAYRMALDDCVAGTFSPQRYEAELETLKNRGYSDNYLFSKPYERTDTQNLDYAISEGEWQVNGIVRDDGVSFMCKDRILPGDVMELITPYQTQPHSVTNDIGAIWQEGERWYIRFDKIITESGKELASVHSGNTNPIKLPTSLPPYSLFRRSLV